MRRSRPAASCHQETSPDLREQQHAVSLTMKEPAAPDWRARGHARAATASCCHRTTRRPALVLAPRGRPPMPAPAPAADARPGAPPGPAPDRRPAPRTLPRARRSGGVCAALGSAATAESRAAGAAQPPESPGNIEMGSDDRPAPGAQESCSPAWRAAALPVTASARADDEG